MRLAAALRSLYVLQVLLACSLICQAVALTETGNDERTCVQGAVPAKRTLQATQRDSQRTVMSSSEQV